MPNGINGGGLSVGGMNAGSTATTSNQVYTDLGSVQNIKTLAAHDKNAALKEISHQFEAVMVQMMMKSMREANAVFGQDDPLNSHEAQMYQDMFDSQLSLSLTKGKGMGIATALMRQLQDRVGITDPAKAGKNPEAVAAADGIPLQRSAIHASELRNLTSALNGDNAADGDDTYEQLLALISEPSFDAAKAQPVINVNQLAAGRLDGSPEQFVDALMPVAEQVSTQLGVDSRVLLSQAALETGWGEKVIRRADGSSSFNFFNIKADANWKGAVVTVPTLEYRDGVAVRETANFRSYNSPEESFADYAQLIGNNPRYQDALARAGDPRAYVQALQRAGYATDPQYAQKVLSVFSSDSLQQAAVTSAALPGTATVAVGESNE